MHANHRNGPGNGYRANAMGMSSIAGSSRDSPEGLMRGHRMYNSEYKNYNRGGYSKQFQSPVPPLREAGIFIEAGRLAAEYLVSKGLLPQIVLSGKWQSDGLKNQMDSSQRFRPRQAETSNGRASVHSRLGNASLDLGQGRRRYSDEYNPVGSRNSLKGRKKAESLKSNGPEVNRDWGRSGLWADNSRTQDMEADTNAFVGRDDEQPEVKNANGGVQNSSHNETNQGMNSEAHLDSELEKNNAFEVPDAKDSSLSNEMHVPSESKGQSLKESPDADKFNDDNYLVRERQNDNDLHQKHDENKEFKASMREDKVVSDDQVDLVEHCKFINLPTRPRSSLIIKGLKINQESMSEDKNIFQRGPSEGSGVHVIDVDTYGATGSASSCQKHELGGLHKDALDSPALEKELDLMHTARLGECSRYVSFLERSVSEEQEKDVNLTRFGRSYSLLTERGEKRPLDFSADDNENFKKLKQWVLPLDVRSDCVPQLSTSMNNQPMVEEPTTSHCAHLTLSPDEKSLDISLFPNSRTDPSQFMEEKQLFPGSFKTFDLNLNENHEANSMLLFSSAKEIGNAARPIDVDLSINHTSNQPIKNCRPGGNENDIEVIDLENDSALDDQTFRDPERRGDNVFSDLDGFPNNVHNANGIPDVQDGYGLMISELLGNDSPNCSSVPTDLNSLHNHMVLPNTEGILGDDDSIYMSLGEIPIRLDQPLETKDFPDSTNTPVGTLHVRDLNIPITN